LLQLMVFFFYYFSIVRYPSNTNKIYSALSITVFITIVLDVIVCIVDSYAAIYPVYVVYGVNMMYLTMIFVLIRLFYAYILALTDNNENWKRVGTYRDIPFLIAFLFIVAEPLTHFFFLVSENGEYESKNAIYLLHGFALVYILMGMFHVIIQRRKMTVYKRISVYLYLALMTLAVIIQALIPDYALLGIAWTVGLMIIYFDQYKANELLDDITGLYNKNSFVTTINTRIKLNKSFSVVAFDLHAAEESIQVADSESSLIKDIIKKRVAGYLADFLPFSSIFKTEDMKFIIIVDDQDADYLARLQNQKKEMNEFVMEICESEHCSENSWILLQILKERMKKRWNVQDHSTLFHAVYFCINFPADIRRTEEVIDMIDSALSRTAFLPEEEIIFASEYVKTREEHIDELMEKQHELEAVRAKLETSLLETEAARAEAEAARLEAEEADHIKTKFVANMSHEIRTPMNAIMGMTELILRDRLSEQVKNNMMNIQSAGSSLLAIVNDVLDFSKIESGKMEIIENRYDTYTLLNNIICMMSPKIQGKVLTFDIDIDPTLPKQLLGDEVRIRQLLLNLLTNAVKYTDSGSVQLQIDWKFEQEEESEEERVAQITYSVKDTGIGIKEDDLNHLFESFTRFEEERNRTIEGSGLGLAICQKLLQMMGSRLNVESSYGQGSRFYFTLRQKIASAVGFACIEEPENYKALIHIEDEILSTSFCSILNRLKIEVRKAGNVTEFSAQLQKHECTHIIMDSGGYEKVRGFLSGVKDAKLAVILRQNQKISSAVSFVIKQPLSVMNVSEIFICRQEEGREALRVDAYIAPEARILIVDDNKVNQQIITGLLRQHQLQIDAASSGMECLKLLEDNRYHLIFMDHMMPGMDGIEVLKAIRAKDEEYFKNVPIVVITANVVSGMRELFQKSGFTDFVGKPVNSSHLEDVVLKYLPGELIHKNQEQETAENEDEPRITFALPQVNVWKGIEYCGGKLQDYIALLVTFEAEGQIKLNRMNALRERGEYDGYRIEVHALKGIAASIGADHLSKTASRFEQACIENKQQMILEEGWELEAEYGELLESIGRVLDDNLRFSEGKTNTGTDMTQEVYDRKLYVLRSLLNDFEDKLIVDEIEEYFRWQMPMQYRMDFQEIKDMMMLFDYENAKEFIQKRM